MIVKDEFLTQVRRYFGLNLYEAKIWLALLTRGVATAGELSDIANVPRSRAYDVLQSLEKKGFVINKLGKPIKYIAIPPKEVVERVKKNLQKEAEERLNRLEKVKESDLMNELVSLHSDGVELVDTSELAGSLRGRHNLYNHIELTIRGAEKSIVIVTSSDGLIREVDFLKPTFEKLHKRGVEIRIAAPINKNCKKAVEQIKDIAEVRDLKHFKARFIIIDSRELIFMLLDDEKVHPSYDVGIWLNSEYFANALQALFDRVWQELPSAEEVLKSAE
ncbi:MAG: helix-turn-helix domain-containing protein [Candidatus Woesearchaeota archaeon]